MPRITAEAHTLQHIQADAAEPVDVGVVDLGEEADLRWRHGVVVGEEELELEDAAWGGQSAARTPPCGGRRRRTLVRRL